MDKPDASCTSDTEHLGSSPTTNGFSIIHSYLSKRNYPRCLCVTAFQLVHFQIAAVNVISPSHMKWDHADVDFISNRKKLETADSSGLQLHIVCQWVRTPTTLTTTSHRAIQSVVCCQDSTSKIPLYVILCPIICFEGFAVNMMWALLHG